MILVLILEQHFQFHFLRLYNYLSVKNLVSNFPTNTSVTRRRHHSIYDPITDSTMYLLLRICLLSLAGWQYLKQRYQLNKKKHRDLNLNLRQYSILSLYEIENVKGGSIVFSFIGICKTKFLRTIVEC